jgi:hypothetical protein
MGLRALPDHVQIISGTLISGEVLLLFLRSRAGDGVVLFTPVHRLTAAVRERMKYE